MDDLEVLASWVGTFRVRGRLARTADSAEPRGTGEEVDDRYRLRQAEPA